MKGIIMSMLTVTGIFFLSSINSCTHILPVPPNNGSTGGDTNPLPPVVVVSCSADTLYFQNLVLPLLNSSCAMTGGCHDAISQRSGVVLTTYANIIATGGVRPGNATNSKLYRVLSNSGEDRMPPAAYPAFTQAQKDIIFKWINQGALNNACNECDTASFTYSLAISPAIATYCKGCHNPQSLGGGIDLSTYAGIKTVALNGHLLGTIQHAAGFSAMPKGSNALSACQVTQIKKWIAAGTLNN